MVAGSHTDTVTITNATNSNGNTTSARGADGADAGDAGSHAEHGPDDLRTDGRGNVANFKDLHIDEHGRHGDRVECGEYGAVGHAIKPGHRNAEPRGEHHVADGVDQQPRELAGGRNPHRLRDVHEHDERRRGYGASDHADDLEPDSA